MDQLKDRGITPPPFHLLSSYGLLRYPEFGGRYARVGIALYGVLSTQEDTQKLGRDLRPALSVKARVASVRRLHPGESAGYGLAFTAQRETVLAAVTIGYADGLPRSLSCGRGSVLINGRRAPIAGRICMDQMLADITDIPDVRAGDVAVILGKSGDLEITSAQLAEQAGTISNEILSRLGSRLMRSRRMLIVFFLLFFSFTGISEAPQVRRESGPCSAGLIHSALLQMDFILSLRFSGVISTYPVHLCKSFLHKRAPAQISLCAGALPVFSLFIFSVFFRLC